MANEHTRKKRATKTTIPMIRKGYPSTDLTASSYKDTPSEWSAVAPLEIWASHERERNRKVNSPKL